MKNKKLFVISGVIAFTLVLALAGFLYYTVTYSGDLGNTESSAGLAINLLVNAKVTCVPYINS